MPTETIEKHVNLDDRTYDCVKSLDFLKRLQILKPNSKM